MSTTRHRVRGLSAALSLLALAGCTPVPATTGSSAAPAVSNPVTASSSASGTLTGVAPLCQAAFGGKKVLGWSNTTLGEARGYLLGGFPKRQPLANAWPELPAGTPVAWCGVEDSVDSMTWWLVAQDQAPISVVSDRPGPEWTGDLGPPVMP